MGQLGAVAYLRGETLRVVDLSSGRDRALARVPVPEFNPPPLAWSADGRWISVGDELVPSMGGAACRPFGPGALLRWSPRGEILAATTSRGVFVGRPVGRSRKILPAGWNAAGFGPGGGRLAAEGPVGSLSLSAVNIATGRRTILYRSPDVHLGPPQLARWSPDGRWILFWTDTESSASIAADGLPLLAVAASGGRTRPLEPTVLRTAQFVQPCGLRQLLVTSGPDRYVSAQKSLHLLAPPRWRSHDLSADPAHSWYDAACSPDGSRILATATRNRDEGRIDSAARTIWLFARAGSRRLLVGSPGGRISFEAARFSRDGHHVLYVEHPTRFGGPYHLDLLDLAAGKQRRHLARISGGFDYYGLHDWAAVAAWYQSTAS